MLINWTSRDRKKLPTSVEKFPARAVEMGYPERRCMRGASGCFKFPGPSSIPTKYQTVIISNVERRGFSSQAKRFTHSVNENPGPGSYLSHTTADTRSPSFSKTGTGGFASKALRVSRKHQRGSPAPNTYNLPSSLLRQHDFNRDVSRTFHPPIAVQTPNAPRKSPAPNQYNVCYSGVEVNSVVSAQSAFLSKTGRSDVYPPAPRAPSPCHYSVNATVIQKTPIVPSSCFKSTSARIQTLVKSEGPGPGSYSPYKTPEPVKRTIVPRRHYLGLAAPPLLPPKALPLPGPGQYDIVNYAGPPKHLMASAAFVSSTRRETHHTRGHGVPGPGSYEPDVPTKRSFLYNHDNMWIPA
ncbi:O(6)-methylguanine-induced apoptosis 2 isoform X2 [Ictalurus punctatus]|uniref:O(6)-methylguanine-induced apoptosis 2 isoform X2 n=2 Tax=Ictalurus punctatus TaxID=7998 RepID=A0A2D0SCS2_ICTPU|nr:O(6)-methylguanine-induced apoptosis 2 isoform X2 [Ictalurus punctatus]